MEKLTVFVLLTIMGIVFWSCYNEITVVRPRAYQAWIKQTGNPKNLTFEEWDDLRRVNERSRDGTDIIFIK